MLAAADFHGQPEVFKKTALKANQIGVNIVVACGDLTHFGSLQVASKLLSLFQDLQMPLLFVPGNCDPPALTREKVGTAESIHGRCRQVDQYNFLGVGGSSPSPFSTPFELAETEIAQILTTAQRNCQSKHPSVVVSHSPPKNTRADKTFTGAHVGSSSVKAFIEKAKPILVLCGHIHEAVGVDTVDKTVVVNTGPAIHGYYATIDLDQKVKVKINRF